MMIGWLCLKGMTVEYLAPGAAGFFVFVVTIYLYTPCQDFCEALTVWFFTKAVVLGNDLSP